MESTSSANETPNIKRSSNVAKRLFISSPPPLIRQNSRKRHFEGVGEEALNLPKKICTSPVTPVVSTTVNESSSLSLMAVSPLTKAKADTYDFDEPVVCTPDDFQLTQQQRSPIIINSASSIIVGTLQGKKGGKNVHFNKQNLQSIKAEVTEKPTAYEMQLIGASLFFIHIFFPFARDFLQTHQKNHE